MGGTTGLGAGGGSAMVATGGGSVDTQPETAIAPRPRMKERLGKPAPTRRPVELFVLFSV
ncbi:protein of unknown function [Pseudorhizobium banfieldiae]|uniref:Uncharacterized protein n=1 Tax=Pseudorhizobium banfieldiae TaxID=1125847 RepID=L0NKF7_9HYPH|nr:protein of unknown function [Pseudorhizobium banfieldiae]